MISEKDCIRNVRNQGTGAVVTEINKNRLLELYETLNYIKIQDAVQRKIIEQRLEDALRSVETVRAFVGSPENILGNKLTKHGEIAEQVDVYFQNARDIINGFEPTATFKGVKRTAPEDYLIGGIPVQSKYINGSSNTLTHVLDHLEKYKDIGFGRDGSFYVIPKDQYSQIQNVLLGETGNLSQKTVRAIRDKVQQIEETTQRSFSDVVRSGNVDYAEVQQGTIHQTLDREVDNLQQNAAKQKANITKESEMQRETAVTRAKPSWGEASKFAGIAAGIGGGMQLAFGIYQKCKAGIKIQNFTLNDWKEVGIDATKAAAEGGISGYAIYGMTNLTNIPAPAASACISFAFGVVELTAAYCGGELTKTEYLAGCQTVCINSVVCAVGSVIGGRLIPVGGLGYIIGAIIASNMLDEICGKGAYGAILNTSEYVYGMTNGLKEKLKKVESNMIHTRTHLAHASSMQKKIEAGFDLFENMKEG